MKNRHTLYSTPSKIIKGFTLLEVMVVIAVIGLIISSVQVSFSGKRPEDALKKASYRFTEVFESAATYGLLNNIELGLYVDEKSYRFLGYDGITWNEIPEQDWLAVNELPEDITLKLSLDDLPIEEPLLFDSSIFKVEDEEYLSFDDLEREKDPDKAKPLFPQVYLLSGGDITPFSLTFQFTKTAAFKDNLSELAYRVTGLYSTPLVIEGPVLDE